jgi:hypothetical protein
MCIGLDKDVGCLKISAYIKNYIHMLAEQSVPVETIFERKHCLLPL